MYEKYFENGWIYHFWKMQTNNHTVYGYNWQRFMYDGPMFRTHADKQESRISYATTTICLLKRIFLPIKIMIEKQVIWVYINYQKAKIDREQIWIEIIDQSFNSLESNKWRE